MIKKVIVDSNGESIHDTISGIEEKISTVFVNSFTEESAKQFYQDFSKASKSGQTVIPIIIDSYGGYVDSLTFMMDLIASSALPVATICLGKAMSCGSILLSCGTEGLRFVSPGSRVMIHHVSSLSYGKVPEIQVEAKEVERLQAYVFKKMAKNCKKPANYFLNLMEKQGNTDWYLTPEDCVKHGLANHIKVPEFHTKITVQSFMS